ncbi:hypothetical protein [Dactylosporangium sp. NPDC005555]|uniref:hypothetical protein n=1 Tax=Dactylosporangium sp. NPDC005555 TaxID=3154889 RepID=UPI0033B2DB4E
MKAGARIALCAGLALVPGFVAAPVHAQPGDGVYMYDTWLTPGMTAKSPGRVATAKVSTAHAGGTVLFDLTELGDVATVTPPGDCTRDGRALTCPVPETLEVRLVLRAGRGAVDGASGTIRTTVAGGTTPATTRVRIGHGADLVPTRERTTMDVEFAGPVPLPVEFTNWGDRTAGGFFLELDATPPFSVDVPGCEGSIYGEVIRIRCRVDERIRPGGHYEGTPFTFRMGDRTDDDSQGYWIVPADRPVGDYTNAEASFDLHVISSADKGADIAVSAGPVVGLVGEVATASVTIRNGGPFDGGAAGTVYLESPAGTEIAGYPDGCEPSALALPAPNPNGEPVQQTTQCAAPVLASGRSHTWKLSFTILRTVPGGYGRVEYRGPVDPDVEDPDTGNNTATLTVQSAPAVAGTAAGTAAGASKSGRGAPIAWWRVVAVTAILVAGAGLAIWARRRAGKA